MGAVLLLLTCASGWGGLDATAFEAYFPQVAAGEAGLRIETRLFVTNSGEGTTRVELDSSALELLSPVGFDLAPGETRSVQIAGGELRAGWVRLRSALPVVGTAIVSTRDSDGSIAGQASILAQPAAARFVIPIFRNSELGQDTGLAVASPTGADVTLTLRDESGREVAARTIRHANRVDAGEFDSHFARFLSELFPDLPAGFTTGSLTVSGPPFLPRTLAVTALYTPGTGLLAAPVGPVDVEGDYLMALEATEDPEAVAATLADQYGFVVVERINETLFLIRTRDEHARAAGRDPRVRRIDPNSLI